MSRHKSQLTSQCVSQRRVIHTLPLLSHAIVVPFVRIVLLAFATALPNSKTYALPLPLPIFLAVMLPPIASIVEAMRRAL